MSKGSLSERITLGTRSRRSNHSPFAYLSGCGIINSRTPGEGVVRERRSRRSRLVSRQMVYLHREASVLDLGGLFDIESVLQGSFGKKCPRPFAELSRQTGLGGKGADAVLSFERTWAHFVDDLLPVIGPGAAAVISGDWSGLSKDNLGDILNVWRVWTRYRNDLEESARRLNPFAKGGRGIDPRVSRAAQAQLKGYDAFRRAIASTEEREKKGAFARFKDWLTGKKTNLRQMIQDFDMDEWAETGWGQATVGVAGAGFVALMSSHGDVGEYRQERKLPERERFRRWSEIQAQYPGASQLGGSQSKSVTKLGYGAVIGHVPDGRVVLQTAVSLWVVDPSEL